MLKKYETDFEFMCMREIAKEAEDGIEEYYKTDEVDAEIAEKDERYINMFIQMEKAGVKITKLEADVAESVGILKLITQSESMNKIVIEQAKAFINKHNHVV